MPTPAFHHVIAINLPDPKASGPGPIRRVAGAALISLGQAIVPKPRKPNLPIR